MTYRQFQFTFRRPNETVNRTMKVVAQTRMRAEKKVNKLFVSTGKLWFLDLVGGPDVSLERRVDELVHVGLGLSR